MITRGIAVIDDGVDIGLSGLSRLEFDIEVNSNMQVSRRLEHKLFMPSHGTTVSAIIKKYAETASIGSLKILGEANKRGMKQQLIKALYWCVQNGVRLVNLSLGTIDFRDFDELKACILDVTQQGLIVVAACNNRNVHTLPACLDNVIGVRCRQIYTDEQYKFHPLAFDGIDISASGRHFITNKSGSRYTSPSNSFAAPLITAMVHRILEEEPGLSTKEIKKKLYMGALNHMDDSYNPYICINTDWVGKYTEINISDVNADSFDTVAWDNSDTVVLSPKSNDNPENESINKFLQAAVRQHKNMVCLQEGLTVEDYNAVGNRGKKIWDCGLYKERLKELLSSGRAGEAEIPVIEVIDSQNADVLNALHILFKKDGYYSVKVSTDRRDILQGCEYLPEISETAEFISTVYGKYDCDVILLRVKNDELRQTDRFNVDIKLVVNRMNCAGTEKKSLIEADCKDVIILELEEQSNEQITKHIEEAFNTILHLFSQDNSLEY